MMSKQPETGRPSNYSHTSEHLFDGSQQQEPTASMNSFCARIHNALLFTWLEQGIEFKECQPYHFRRIRLASGVSDKLYIE